MHIYKQQDDKMQFRKQNSKSILNNVSQDAW